MRKNIGIVWEGPTDYIMLKGIVDSITKEEHQYFQLQPEDNLMGEYGNGWKGVWKWCMDHGGILDRYMTEITPQLDFLIVQLDGDVARKEREVHCLCKSTVCERSGTVSPLHCEGLKGNDCPIKLPCSSHNGSPQGYMEHLTSLARSWLNGNKDACIAIPCDSTDAWVAAAYDQMENIEMIEDPWINIISKGKEYHKIRIPGHKKRLTVYRQFVDHVCEQWEEVKRLCLSAVRFEENIISSMDSCAEQN